MRPLLHDPATVHGVACSIIARGQGIMSNVLYTCSLKLADWQSKAHFNKSLKIGMLSIHVLRMTSSFLSCMRLNEFQMS